MVGAPPPKATTIHPTIITSVSALHSSASSRKRLRSPARGYKSFFHSLNCIEMVNVTVFSRLFVLLTLTLAFIQCVSATDPPAKMKGMHRLAKRGTKVVRRASIVKRLTIVKNEKRLDIPEKQFKAIKEFQNSVTDDPKGITDSWGPPLDDEQLDELDDGGDEEEVVDDGSGDYADDGSGGYADDGSGGYPDDGSGGGGGGFGIPCDPGCHCVQVSDPSMFTDLSAALSCSDDGLTCEFDYGAVVDIACLLDGSEAVIYFDDAMSGESYIEGITAGAIAGAFADDGFTTQESVYPDDSVMMDCYYDQGGYSGGYDDGSGMAGGY